MSAPAYPTLLGTEGDILMGLLPTFMAENIHIREIFWTEGIELDDLAVLPTYASALLPDTCPVFMLAVWELALGLDSADRIANWTTAARRKGIAYWIPWADVDLPDFHATGSGLTSEAIVRTAFESAWPEDAGATTSFSIVEAEGTLEFETPALFPTDRFPHLLVALDRMAPAHVQVSVEDASARWTGVAVH